LTSVCERCGGKREKEDRRNELREEKNSQEGKKMMKERRLEP
jgi:hypothetical protein